MPYCPYGHGEKKSKYCDQCGAEVVETPPTGDSVRVRSSQAHATANPTFVLPGGSVETRPALVRCPQYGQRKPEHETFDCQGECSRQNLCLRHFDEEYDVCQHCARILRGADKAEAERQAKLQADLSSWRSRAEQAEAQVADLTGQSAQAQQALEQTRADLRQVQERVLSLEQELAAQRSRAEHAEANVATLTKRGKQVETNLAQRTADLSQSQERVQTLEEDLAGWRGRAEKAEAQLIELSLQYQVPTVGFGALSTALRVARTEQVNLEPRQYLVQQPYLESVTLPDLRFRIMNGVTTIGRHPESSICITERFLNWETASRRHAEIREEGDYYVIYDVSNRNGVYVEGQRTVRNLLRPGWRIGIGGVEFIFRDVTAATPSLSAESPGTQVRIAAKPQPVHPIVGAAADITQALATLQVDFSLLSPGALLGNGQTQYVILAGQVEQLDVRHVYKAEHWPSQVGAGPEPTQFLIVEVQDPILVDRERILVDRKLPDTGLLLPVAAFKERLWEESSRHYLVYTGKPMADLLPASDLPRPRPLESVLEWGAVLATGLQTLHDNQIAHTHVNPQNILVSSHDARLTGFENIKGLQKTGRDHRVSMYYQSDIADLATSLQDLLGGPRVVLPAEVSSVLQRGQGEQTGQFYADAGAFSQALRSVKDTLKPHDINVKSGHSIDTGRVRDHNEDNVIVLEKGILRENTQLTYGIYAVADGMGGDPGGSDPSDLAIMTAVRSMTDAVRKLEQPDSRQMQAIAKQACLAANKAVFDERRKRRIDIDTTLVAALRIGNQVALCNIGDSRAYLINAKEIRLITFDQPLVQRLIDTDQISPTEARTYSQRHLIRNVVGDKPTPEPDVFGVRMQTGDRLLLCSDGLWRMIDDHDIWRIVLMQQDPQESCNQLINYANQAGGEDNISVIVICAY